MFICRVLQAMKSMMVHIYPEEDILMKIMVVQTDILRILMSILIRISRKQPMFQP